MTNIEAPTPSSHTGEHRRLTDPARSWARNPSQEGWQGAWVIAGDDGRRRELLNSLIFHSDIEPDFTEKRRQLEREIYRKKVSRRVMFALIIIGYTAMAVFAVILLLTAPTVGGQVAAALSALFALVFMALSVTITRREVKRRKQARSRAGDVLRSLGYTVNFSYADFTRERRE